MSGVVCSPLACAASSRTNEECASDWLAGAGALVAKDEHNYARAALEYYLDMDLRAK
jgi:hypothetical protein